MRSLMQKPLRKGCDTVGWGYVLTARRNHGTDHEERRELIEWHKFDDMYHEFAHVIHYTRGEPEVVVNKKQLAELLRIVSITPDYWAYCFDEEREESILPNVDKCFGFSTVEQLCEIYHAYNSIIQEGWELVFSGG